MCLYTTNITPLTATEPIQVWKILIKTDNGFATPYQRVAVKVGESLKALIPYTIDYRIAAEGVHAYKTKHAATVDKVFNEIITEWEIPAGAKYWLGNWRSKGEIAATEMKFVKICED